MTHSPIPANHLTLEVLPSSIRNLAVTTFAAACASRLLRPEYSSDNSNVIVTIRQSVVAADVYSALRASPPPGVAAGETDGAQRRCATLSNPACFMSGVRPNSRISSECCRGFFCEMVPAEGFEPPTYGLQNRCTTTVLSRQSGADYNRLGRLARGLDRATTRKPARSGAVAPAQVRLAEDCVALVEDCKGAFSGDWFTGVASP
jgi:hypothetical protein